MYFHIVYFIEKKPVTYKVHIFFFVNEMCKISLRNSSSKEMLGLIYLDGRADKSNSNEVFDLMVKVKMLVYDINKDAHMS